MDVATSRKLAQYIAWGRIGIGATAIATPVLVSRPWIGDAAARPASRLLARALGGRDLALGIGALRALAISDQEARPWVALGGTADALDALATVIAFANLPRRWRWSILAVTAAAAAASIRAATTLDAVPFELGPAPSGD
jgi:hypothetical protein